MQREIITERAISYVQALFAENAGGHDADHTLRVYRNAMLIAEHEPGCDKEVVTMAALLHDADDHKLFQTENNANARRFLEENHIPAEGIDLICEVIGSVSFSQNRGKTPRTLEGKIVQDADRLDALGAIGIARTFAYGGEHGRSMADSLQHFYDKLLLLKNMMHTETGRQMAEGRHGFLLAFLEEWKAEEVLL
ncbi:MAG: HD domain-containing protein [Lachnospiraceae bacterium]|nr:HD domain-containing protein [Lachnospiraceae bacterium]